MPSFLAALAVLVTEAAGISCPATAAPAAAPAAPAKARGADAVERIDVEASDGTTIAAWHYPVAESVSPLGVVLLLHDLGGSHQTVEPLARALQTAGCGVVAPDLRGHGESRMPSLPSTHDNQAKLLKRPDFEMMAVSRGGRIRDQSAMRGDVECLRNWIVRETREGRMPKAPLFVVGSGLGASVGAHWAAADAAWPDSTSGPQGREVAGLVLISPAYSIKGFSLGPALAAEAVRQTIPILMIAGAGDRDAAKVFDQLKRLRPKVWYDARRPPGGEKDASPAKATEATLMLFSHPGDRSGDDLAAGRSADKAGRTADPAAILPGFISVIVNRGG